MVAGLAVLCLWYNCCLIGAKFRLGWHDTHRSAHSLHNQRQSDEHLPYRCIKPPFLFVFTCISKHALQLTSALRPWAHATARQVQLTLLQATLPHLSKRSEFRHHTGNTPVPLYSITRRQRKDTKQQHQWPNQFVRTWSAVLKNPKLRPLIGPKLGQAGQSAWHSQEAGRECRARWLPPLSWPS